MAIIRLQAGCIDLATAINSPKSQSFGRRIYLIEQQGRNFWLKLQLQSATSSHDYLAHEQSFLNELDCYRQLKLKETCKSTLLLNFSILNTSQYFQKSEGFIEQTLCVEDAPLLFPDNIDQLPRTEILRRLKLSLDVLENLHEYGYIHGDLKVVHFRYPNDVAALIDFEQASTIERVRYMPNTATPRYMAPELFHAEPKSFASDIYALGIIWLEWLTQTRFKQKHYLDWANLHCQSLKIDLPIQFEMLEEILLMMLMKNKVQRCSNIYQLKQVLNQIV